jgi:hypothetical protein
MSENLDQITELSRLPIYDNAPPPPYCSIHIQEEDIPPVTRFITRPQVNYYRSEYVIRSENNAQLVLIRENLLALNIFVPILFIICMVLFAVDINLSRQLDIVHGTLKFVRETIQNYSSNPPL